MSYESFVLRDEAELQQVRTCSYCSTPRPVADFVKGRKRCRSCRAEYKKQLYRRDPKSACAKISAYRAANREKANRWQQTELVCACCHRVRTKKRADALRRTGTGE